MSIYASRSSLLVGFALSCFLVDGCGSSDHDASTSTGGQGPATSAGHGGSGGESKTGSAPATGGTTATGGTSSGTTALQGSGGSSLSSTAGVTGTGGMTGTGGATGLGGVTGLGGSSSTVVDAGGDAGNTCEKFSGLDCASDSDCCLIYDECGSALILVSKPNADGMSTCRTAKDAGVCTACIPPAVETWCQNGRCVATALAPFEAGKPHCGRLPAHYDAGTVAWAAEKYMPRPAHPQDVNPIDASVPSGKTIFGCGH